MAVDGAPVGGGGTPLEDSGSVSAEVNADAMEEAEATVSLEVET